MKRLTTDKPSNNTETVLNYAYAKEGEAHLRYANGKEDIRLTEYLSCLAQENGCESATEENILHGDVCSGCDCEVAILNVLAIQAAELRERLKKYEDAEEQGLLVRLPCKPGDTVYWLNYNRSACNTCDLFSSFYGVDCMCDKHYEIHPEINSVYDDEHCPKHFIEIVNMKADLEWIVYHLNDFGKTIFLTEEAAEKALEEICK